jgi:hypothetical protein
MSRAVVKETETTELDFPDRPISPHRNFLTEGGLANIEDAFSRLKSRIARRVATGTPPPASREIRYQEHGARGSGQTSEEKSEAYFGMTAPGRFASIQMPVRGGASRPPPAISL